MDTFVKDNKVQYGKDFDVVTYDKMQYDKLSDFFLPCTFFKYDKKSIGDGNRHCVLLTIVQNSTILLYHQLYISNLR